MGKKVDESNLLKELNTGSVFFKGSDKPEPIKEKPSQTHRHIDTDVYAEKDTKPPIITPTEGKVKAYLNLYTFTATREDLKKDRNEKTNIAIKDSLKEGMDHLITINEKFVATETDKSYTDIIENALFEYLQKQYKRLQSY